VDDGN